MSVQTSSRLTRVHHQLGELSLDAVLVSNLTNVRYLTGFTGSAGSLVVGGGDAVLHVDGRYTEQAEQQFAAGRVQTTRRDILGGLLDLLMSKASARRLGFEGRHLPYDQWRRVADALLGVDVVPTFDLVEALRARKDSAEVAAIRRAVDITDRAYGDLLTWIAPGMAEYEVAARCEYFQRSQGADRKETRTAVGSGPRSSQPHCIAADRVLVQNEPVLFDLGCVVDGYTSDLTRTIFLGEPPEEFRAIHTLVGEALSLAIKAIRPGLLGKEVHAVAHEYLAQHGYGDKFPHALGHSLGLNIHERPAFAEWEDRVIDAGNVITVEPGIYLPGKYGVRTEDLILVTESGSEVLNHTLYELMVR